MAIVNGRPRPPFAGAILAPILLALVTACGAAEEPKVATADNGGAKPAASVSGSAAAGGSGNAVAQFVEARREYVRCLRQEGIHIPDPGPKGELEFGEVGADGTDQRFNAANKKCEPKLRAVPPELANGPPMTPEQIAAARKYAACMRANGDPDFRDPGPDGHWLEETAAPNEQRAAAGARAGRICEPVLAGRPAASADPGTTGVG